MRGQRVRRGPPLDSPPLRAQHAAPQCGIRERVASHHGRYEDYFDIMGTGYHWLLGFSAPNRYRLGWFGADEVQGITSAGTYTIRAIGLPLDGVDTGSTAVKRAAFVRTPSGSSEADGVWVEFVGGASDMWGTTDDSFSAGVPVKPANSIGLFIRKDYTLIDAKRQLCAPGSYADEWAWQDELVETTLNAGSAYLDQSTGIRLSEVNVADDGGSVSFRVSYEAPAACYRDYPRIAEGLIGEYRIIIEPAAPGHINAQWVSEFAPHVASAPGYGLFVVNAVQDLDRPTCARSKFALDVAELPSGWGKVSYWGGRQTGRCRNA